jgi:hypothetical protein
MFNNGGRGGQAQGNDGSFRLKFGLPRQMGDSNLAERRLLQQALGLFSHT